MSEAEGHLATIVSSSVSRALRCCASRKTKSKDNGLGHVPTAGWGLGKAAGNDGTVAGLFLVG